MEDKHVLLSAGEPQPVEAVFVPEKSHAIARHLAGTLLGVLVFAAAVLLSGNRAARPQYRARTRVPA